MPLASSTRIVATLTTALVAGCASLLPDADSATQAGWQSYDEGREAIQRIVPYRTRRADLAAAGFDPRENPAITILSYSDIVQRLNVGAAVRPEDLDPGIRECLSAAKACSAYALNVRKVRRDRIGNFWLDSFNFRRITETTGWTFNALILMVGDQVVFTVHGGQPRVHEIETVRNPLGPLQGWGDAVGGKVIR